MRERAGGDRALESEVLRLLALEGSAAERLRTAGVGAALSSALQETAPGDRIGRYTLLGLIGRGFSNKRIALELGIAEKTVKTHVGHVLAKLGVADRTQAALHAVRAGLVAEGPR